MTQRVAHPLDAALSGDSDAERLAYRGRDKEPERSARRSMERGGATKRARASSTPR